MNYLSDQKELISFGALAIDTGNKEIKVVNHTSAPAM